MAFQAPVNASLLQLFQERSFVSLEQTATLSQLIRAEWSWGDAWLRRKCFSCHNFEPLLQGLRILTKSDPLSIPEPRRFVLTSRHHTFPICAERHSQDRILVAHWLAQCCARPPIPEPRRLVFTSRQHALSIRAECHGQDSTFMAHWLAQCHPRPSIPE